MFLNLIMLCGLGAAALPLVLHLLSRARYRSFDWGAMMFLSGAEARQRQSARIRQWILLAVRMLLVALLAVALARPVVAWRSAALGRAAPVSAVIILDDSAAMGFDQNGRTRLDQARNVVNQILSTSLGKGDEAALILASGRAHDPPPQFTPDLQSLCDSVAPANLRPSANSASMADALEKAAALFDTAHGVNRELYIVCDQQTLVWRDVTGAFAARFRDRLAKPGPIPRIVVIPVGGRETDNLAVEAIELLNPPLIAGQAAEAEIRIRNYGPTPRAALPLTFLVDGKPLLSTTVNVAPFATATVRGAFTIARSGSHVLTARIETVGLTFDDELDSAVDVIDPIGVLVIAGDARAADYVGLALAPFRALGRSGPDLANVQIVPAWTAGWDQIDSQKYRVVILANLPEISPLQARSLEQHAYGGGGVILAPGNLTNIQNFNDVLYRDGQGLSPASLQPATPASAAATTLLGIDLAHPIFRFLKGKPDPIPTATIARYFPARPRQAAAVLGNYATGQPFLMERSLGRGRVLLLTTPLDDNWGTLPLSNFFLPFVQSAVRYLAPPADRNLAPGQPLTAQIDEPGEAKSVTIADPSGAIHSVPILRASDLAEIRFTDTDEPGVYTLTTPDQSISYVVVASRQASDLTPLTDPQWNALRDSLAFTLVPDSSEGSVSAALARNRHELWPLLLAAVFVLAVSEIALASAWSKEAE